MIRIVLPLLLALVTAGCASKPAAPTNSFAPYRAQEAAATASAGKKAYRLGVINVTLKQARVNEKFPDEAALKEIFTALLQKDLESKGYLAAQGEEAIAVDFDINYQRVFMGEAFGFSKGWGSSEFDYASRLSRNGVLLADYRSGRLMVNKGLAGNLLKLGKQLSSTGSPEDEQAEIAVYAKGMVDQLPH